MGEFDFGQFQEIYQYLIDKLNDGDALTPQEQQVFDTLMGFSNEGLNLTNTADFNSLYKAFNGLADDATKSEFEKLYGTDLAQDPDNGRFSFTRPGSVMEQFQRRGLSVNDGPAMAAFSEGLKNFTKQLTQNKFNSMTNSYAAMTPIRAQNIQAAQGAGNVASTAIGRRVPVAGVAGGGARRGGGGGGEGEGPGEGEPIKIPVPPGPPTPSILERLAPDLFKWLLGGAGAIGSRYLDKLFMGDDKTNKYSDQDLDRATKDIVDRNPFESIPNQAQPEDQGALSMANPFSINAAAFSGGQTPTPFPIGPEAQYPQGGGYDLDPNQYYGQGSQGYQSLGQQPYDYSDYSNSYQQPQSFFPQENYYDNNYNDFDWSGWDQGGGGDYYDYSYDAPDYNWSSGGDSYYDDGSGWF